MSDKNPKIRFGNEELPTHQVWRKLEIAHQALDLMDRYNEERPDLATDETRETAKEVRKRLGSIEILLPEKPEKNAELEERARELLKTLTPEEVIDVLRSEHGVESDLQGLIYLAGQESYLASLANEAGMLRNNAISLGQIADLWNEARRPAPGKPFWDAKAVELVIQGRMV